MHTLGIIEIQLLVTRFYQQISLIGLMIFKQVLLNAWIVLYFPKRSICCDGMGWTNLL